MCRCANAKMTIMGMVAIRLAAEMISQWCSPPFPNVSMIYFRPRGIVNSELFCR